MQERERDGEFQGVECFTPHIIILAKKAKLYCFADPCTYMYIANKQMLTEPVDLAYTFDIV